LPWRGRFCKRSRLDAPVDAPFASLRLLRHIQRRYLHVSRDRARRLFPLGRVFLLWWGKVFATGKVFEVIPAVETSASHHAAHRHRTPPGGVVPTLARGLLAAWLRGTHPTLTKASSMPDCSHSALYGVFNTRLTKTKWAPARPGVSRDPASNGRVPRLRHRVELGTRGAHAGRQAAASGVRGTEYVVPRVSTADRREAGRRPATRQARHVPGAGLEPARPLRQTLLRRPCLPIPPSRLLCSQTMYRVTIGS
jgi:hypothetical protein